MNPQTMAHPLHLIHGRNGPLLYDTNRVRTYSCSAAEAYLHSRQLVDSDDTESGTGFDEETLIKARKRLERLEDLSRSLAEEIGIEDPYRGYPTYLMLHVCDNCNLRCSYCYAEGCHPGDTAARMTAGIATASVDHLLDHCPENKDCTIAFAGGEPLLNIEAVEAAMIQARNRQKGRSGKVELRILTNGTVMSPRILRLINEHRVFLQISLDGPPEVHDRLRLTSQGRGSSAKVLETIAVLRRNGFRRFRVRATLSRHNADADKIAAFYRDQGIRNFSIQPVMCGSGSSLRLDDAELGSITAFYRKLVSRVTALGQRATDDIPEDILSLLAKLSVGLKTKRHCGAGRTMLVVSPDGEFYPCPALIRDPGYRAGEIGQEQPTPPAKRLANLEIDSKSQCRACWVRNLCGGGCAAQAVQINGEPGHPDPQECAVIKARTEAAIAIHHHLQNERTVFPAAHGCGALLRGKSP